MRPTAFFRFLCPMLMALSLLFPKSGSAQGNEKITIAVKNASLTDVFRQIEKQSRYKFIYTSETIEGAGTVTVNVKNENIQNTLQACFENQPFTWSIEDNQVIVQKKLVEKRASLRDVSGTVKDEKGQPLGGISVIVSGTTNGTGTASDGSFYIPQVPLSATLIFSGINVESMQTQVYSMKSVNVILKSKVANNDEVQVVAYGTTTKKLNTGDVSTIKAEVIAEQPVSNPLAAMEGRAPGLVITENSGIPGSGFFVQIRGQNSIGSGNNPLYVVDGVPFPSMPLGAQGTTSANIQGGSPLSSINPSDIESISILKDADATSIYGSRGANGVILITTKKGKSGTTKADASFYVGTGHIARSLDMLNTLQYLQMRHEAFANDGETPTVDNAPDLLSWDTTRYTNWEKDLIGNTSSILDAQASLSGGNMNTQFLFGLGYHQQSTVFPGDFISRRFSGHLNLNHTSADQKLKLSVYMNYSNFDNNLPGGDPTFIALSTSPNAPPVYDSSGKLNWASGTFFNPYSKLLQEYNGNTANIIGHADISYLLTPHLQLQFSGGINNLLMQETTIYPVQTINPRFNRTSGNSAFANNNYNTWILEPQILYKTNISRGALQVLVGSTLQQDLNNAQSISASGFSSDALLKDLQAASTTYINSVINTNYKYAAIFGRINYNWQDRYLVNLTARRDGSSRFGPGKQFANFGAVGAAWIFSKTSFMQEHLSGISFAKIRASYGTTGNDQIGDYGYLNTYTATPYPYLGTTGLVSTSLYNPDYSWEVNRKMEAGLEVNFLKDRLSTSVSFYRNRSSNQLIGYPLPLITGQPSVQENLPATVQNTGWEFLVSMVDIKTNDFTWTTTINMTVPANKLIAFPNLAGSSYADSYVVGQSLYIQKLYHFTSVDKQTGLYTFEDVNHDGQITYPEDLTAYKKVAQNFYGGFMNSLEYKNFKLEVFFQFVDQTGRNYLNSAFGAPGMFNNEPDYVLNRWQKQGDIKPVQQYTQDYGSAASSAYNNVAFSDNMITGASYIRLKNLSLGYSLNRASLQKLHVSAVTIFIQGQNLLTITHYQGMDPENMNMTVVPLLRVVTAGIHCSL
jgi:TonB-dependent starch-binding outer membrane protein SusC